ncbi:MAG TPA: hypothetical protein VE046_12755 [Steroidobacteraceae bacterium]|nr:hypothetical protein [Steroidobacteraceae bacterium]
MNRPTVWIAAMLAAAAATAETGPGAAAQPEPPAAVAAAWAEHDVDFNFFGHGGFQNIYYNCDAAQSKLEQLLRLAGARKDLRVRVYGCAGSQERITSFLRADLHFQSPTLTPPAGSALPADAPMPVSSEWKPVKLRLGWTNGFEPGDCMLVEQFRVQVLKYFDLRNLTSDLPCSIRFAPAGRNSSLAFEALTALPTAEAESLQVKKVPAKHDDTMKSDRN